jgi:hypothetical protein
LRSSQLEHSCGALGILVLVQRDSVTQLVLGVYLIGLSTNYVPMLIYAIGITTNKSTRAELGQELTDEPRVMAKDRSQSLLLLVPFLVPTLLSVRSARTSGIARIEAPQKGTSKLPLRESSANQKLSHSARVRRSSAYPPNTMIQ